MKRTAIAALGAAMFATLGTSSVTQAAMINFTVVNLDGTPTYTGTSLEDSTAVDIDGGILIVQEVDAGDDSGLAPGDTSVSLSPTNIVYGSGSGPMALSGDAIVTKSWTGDNGDSFMEQLTKVDLIDRSGTDEITVRLSGTLNDSLGLFTDTPAFFVLKATQFGGVGTVVSVSFTNTAGSVTPGIPEPSTWVMMAVGFVALGYAAFRKPLSFGRRTSASSV